jgi:hypothetical protein
MAATPEEQAAKMIESLKEKTGRSLDEWRAELAPMASAKHGEVVAHLKSLHGVTHGYANMIVHALRTPAAAGGDGGDDLVDAQYAGRKQALRPLYDRIEALVRTFGGDVDISPKKTCVSFRRSKQFALAQPTTATRLDIGIQLKGVAAEGRLEDAGSFCSGMVTHRFRVSAESDIDGELEKWLRLAYERA